jgi:hypothetical protein
MKTYTERPPASAQAARKAWDILTAKNPGRPPKELYYCPNYDLTCRKGWVMEWNYRSDAEQTNAWSSLNGGSHHSQMHSFIDSSAL